MLHQLAKNCGCLRCRNYLVLMKKAQKFVPFLLFFNKQNTFRPVIDVSMRSKTNHVIKSVGKCEVSSFYIIIGHIAKQLYNFHFCGTKKVLNVPSPLVAINLSNDHHDHSILRHSVHSVFFNEITLNVLTFAFKISVGVFYIK